MTNYICHRAGYILHLYDRSRRWGSTSGRKEVPGRLCARSQGQLLSLARGADAQLQSYSHSIPDCKKLLSWRRLLYDTNMATQPFVSTIGIAWTAYLSLTNSSDEA